MPTATLSKSGADRQWTYDQIVAEFPESNQPTELWDGLLLKSPSPRPEHQEMVLNFARLLREFVLSRRLGRVFASPLDVVFTQRRVVQPDVVFVSRENAGIIQDRIRGVPDLVVEIISAGSWRRDRIDKKALYEQFEVAEYWIVDPERRSLEVFTLNKGTYALHARGRGHERAASRLLRGFELAYSELER